MIAVLAALILLPAAARAEGVSARVQAKNLIRVLTYDRKFEDRFGSDVTIGVLFNADDPKSKSAADSIQRELKALDTTLLGERRLRVRAIGLKAGGDVTELVSDARPGVLFVCTGMGAVVSRVVDLAQSRDIVTIGATRAFVEKGLSFGIVSVAGKPSVLINRPASRKEGTRFSAQLLRIAEVIE